METTPRHGVGDLGGDDKRLSSRGNTQRRKVDTIPRSPFVKRAVKELEQKRQSNRLSKRISFIHHDERLGDVFSVLGSNQIHENQIRETRNDFIAKMSQFNDLKLLSRTIIKEKRTLEAHLCNDEEEIERLKDAHSSFVESLSRLKRSLLNEEGIENFALLEDLKEEQTKNSDNEGSKIYYEVDFEEELGADNETHERDMNAALEYSVNDDEGLLPQPMNLTQVLLESSKSESRYLDSSSSSEKSNFYRRSLLSDYKDPIMEKEMNRITTDIQNNHQFRKRVRRSDESSLFLLRQSVSSSGLLRKQLDNLLHIDMQKKLRNIESQYEFTNQQRRDSSFVDSNNTDNDDNQVIAYDETEKTKEKVSFSDIIADEDKLGSDGSSSDDEIMILDSTSLLADNNTNFDDTSKKESSTKSLLPVFNDDIVKISTRSNNDDITSTPQRISDTFNIIDQPDTLEKQYVHGYETEDVRNIENDSNLSGNSTGEQKETLQYNFEGTKFDSDVEANLAADTMSSVADLELKNPSHFSGLSGDHNDYAEDVHDTEKQLLANVPTDGFISRDTTGIKSPSSVRSYSMNIEEEREGNETGGMVKENTYHNSAADISFETGRDVTTNKLNVEDDFMNEMEMTGIIAPEDLADYDTSQLSKNNDLEFGLEQVLSSQDSEEDENYYNYGISSEMNGRSIVDMLMEKKSSSAGDHLKKENPNMPTSSNKYSNGRFPKKFIKEISEFLFDRTLVDFTEAESFDFDSDDLKLFSKLSINSMLKKGRRSNAKLSDKVLQCIEEILDNFLENQISDLMELAEFGKRKTLCANDMLLLIKRSKYFKDLKKDGKLVDGNVFNYVFSQASELFSVEELNEIQNDCMN